MKTKKILWSVVLLMFALTACIDNVPQVEPLPSAAVSFEYKVVDTIYTLDFYTDANIEFKSTSAMEGKAVWDFGDGQTAEGDVVYHSYSNNGTFRVRLTIQGTNGKSKSKEKPLMIAAIKPLMSINPIEGVCEVLTTKVSFSLEVPNPKDKQLEYEWIFPANTTDGEDNPMTVSTNELPGDVKFGNVGSQTVRLRVKMIDGETGEVRQLEEASINVQVGYNQEVPTLYYAVKGGNIMALKLVPEVPENMLIEPYDMGVSAGQHAFNLCFAKDNLYILDAGKQFNYVNDENGVMGDGKISVMSKDGSKVDVMIDNIGQAAFDDPFYGCVVGENLYYTNRGTGFIKIGLDERNKKYSAKDFPWYVQNNYLGYYGAGISYGAINGGLIKIGDMWYWSKTYNAQGIFRFTDDDILSAPVTAADPVPAGGILLPGMSPKAMCYNKTTGAMALSMTNDAGLAYPYFFESIAEIEGVGSSTNAVQAYKMKHESGQQLNTIVTAGRGEGSSGEFCGITQIAVDETTNRYYFGYRTAGGPTDCRSGLMYYDANEGKVYTLLEGIEVYGVVINTTPSKLF